jgi:hypothetical protein
MPGRASDARSGARPTCRNTRTRSLGLGRNPHPPTPIGDIMEWNLTSKIATATLVFGALFFILSIALLGTSPADIGMLATTIVFLLFGVFGIFLGRQQAAA